MKVSFFDRRIYKISAKPIALVSSALSVILLFLDIPKENKIQAGLAFFVVLILIYVAIWIWTNKMSSVKLSIEGSEVHIKVADIFEQSQFKVISFNEYFDTLVDDEIIAASTLNGQFIRKFYGEKILELDSQIAEKLKNISGQNTTRTIGKKVKYPIGTICVLSEDYLLTALSKFDDQNRAVLTMPEYLEFLINFWDQINRVYAMKCVATPIFGSGILRIKDNKNIKDEELLKIMLWTFRISEMKFKFPARLTIVIHEDKIDQINLLDIASSRNGL